MHTCVHVYVCHIKIVLPAAFATSAIVTFWMLGLTLKVTAGPRTLEEIIRKGVRAASEGGWGQHSTSPASCTRAPPHVWSLPGLRVPHAHTAPPPTRVNMFLML